MLAPTHSVFAIFLSLSTLALFGIKAGMHWSIIAFTILGALMPDVDLTRSTIGKLLPFISKPLERKFGHRTITHSFVGLAIACVILGFILACFIAIQQAIDPYRWLTDITLAIRWFAAFAIGYFSHLILDMLNIRGSQMFWPNNGRDVIPKNPKHRIEVGSIAEFFVFLLCFAFMIMSFPLSKYGLKSSLRWLLATPHAVMQEYKELETKLIIEFNGMFDETRTPIEGAAEILDVKNKNLIVLLQNRVFTLSDEFTADIIAFKIRYKNTDTPIKVIHKEFQQKPKEYLFSQIPEGALVSGTIKLPKNLQIQFPPQKETGILPPTTFKTMQQKKDTLILKFASKAELETLGLDNAYTLYLERQEAELLGLKIKTKTLKKQIQKVKTSDGLTPLGRKLLLTQKERQDQADQLEDLNQKLSILKIKIKEMTQQLESSKFVFTGEVSIRQ